MCVVGPSWAFIHSYSSDSSEKGKFFLDLGLKSTQTNGLLTPYLCYCDQNPCTFTFCAVYIDDNFNYSIIFHESTNMTITPEPTNFVNVGKKKKQPDNTGRCNSLYCLFAMNRQSRLSLLLITSYGAYEIS